MESAIAEVRQLLVSVLGSEVVDSIEDDDRFFDDHLVDSLQLIEIVDGFQSRFGIEVSGEDLSPENFGSVAGMATFLTNRSGTTGSPG